jgi:two-component system, NarL family, nitrate/nitrite response regulator NarL
MGFDTPRQRAASRRNGRKRDLTAPIGLFVIAGTRLYREGLERILGRDERIEVVGSASGLDTGVELARDRQADLVLLDIAAVNELEALRGVVTALPGARVVAFGIAESEDVVIRCAEAGVAGYVPHEATLEELVEVLEAALRDEVVCSPRLAGTLLRRVGALARERDPVGEAEVRLTARETQIIALVDEGLSNKQIAARLQIGTSTVKNHVHHILEKVGAGRRSEAAARVRALRATR